MTAGLLISLERGKTGYILVGLTYQIVRGEASELLSHSIWIVSLVGPEGIHGRSILRT
jgi:hypothetical protein